MAKSNKIARAQKEFLKAMKKKFSEDPDAPGTETAKELTPKGHCTLVPYK
jgi:methyl coenzyme M reductase alpha subunit